MSRGQCDICGFELTDEDLSYANPADFWKHCKEHSNYATYPQLWLLKKELRLPYEEPKKEDRICAVCGMPLSDEEINLVEKTHVNFTCKFHKKSIMDFNIQLTRSKLGYSEYLTKKPIDQMIEAWKL